MSNANGWESWAARVVAAAKAVPACGGWFGDNKVFICAVARAMGMDLAAFKTALVHAQRQGLVTLSRADLVEAMDRAQVAASETAYLDATWHFVRVS